jgi:hypothetical protein
LTIFIEKYAGIPFQNSKEIGSRETSKIILEK